MGYALPRGKAAFLLARRSFAQDPSVFIRLYPCSSVFQRFASRITPYGKRFAARRAS
jgi:hypothetical protein